MGFHYAKEKAKFDREWCKLRKLYEQAGMSESAIDEIYTYDWRCFCSQRTYENRTQPLPDLYILDEGQSVRSSLLKKFPALSTTFDNRVSLANMPGSTPLKTPTFSEKSICSPTPTWNCLHCL